MKLRILFICSLLLLSATHCLAGIGALLTVVNATPFPALLSIDNTASANWDDEDAWNCTPGAGLPDNSKLAAFTSYPLTGAEYIESNNGYDGASTANVSITFSTPPNSPIGQQYFSAVICISEAAAAYTASGPVSNAYFTVTPVVVPAPPGSQWTITINITYNIPGISAGSWMSNSSNIQNSSLSQITILGAHDAAMSNTISCSLFGNSCNAVTQNDNFYTMLSSDGVRYFDCRPIINSGDQNIYLGHFTNVGSTVNDMITSGVPPYILPAFGLSATIEGAALQQEIGYQGCTGMSLASALSEIKSYLVSSANGGHEVIILDFSHSYVVSGNNTGYFDSAQAATLFTQVLDSLRGYLCLGNNQHLTTPIGQLTASGSKVIVWVASSDISGNINQWVTGDSGIYVEPTSLYNIYCGCNNLPAVVTDQFTKLDSNSLDYFALSWTLTESNAQTFFCSIGQTATQAAYDVALGGGYLYDAEDIGWSLTNGESPSSYVSSFFQANPYTSILTMSQAATDNLSIIPTKCVSMHLYPNILLSDDIGIQHLNTTIALNMLRGRY